MFCKQTLSLVGLDNGASELKSWRVERLDLVTSTQIASAVFFAVSFWGGIGWRHKSLSSSSNPLGLPSRR